jgi:hypothetical protein
VSAATGPRPVAVVRVAAIVLVLAAIAVAAVWLGGRRQPVGERQIPPIGLAGRKPADPLAIADFAGSGQLTAPLDDYAVAGALLTPAEIAVFKTSGLKHVAMADGRFAAGNADIVVAQLGSPAQARTAQRALVKLQLGFGFSADPHTPAALGATVLGDLPGRKDVLPGGRAHYTHGDLLIRVEYRGPGAKAAQQAFAQVLAEQLEALPADG